MERLGIDGGTPVERKMRTIKLFELMITIIGPTFETIGLRRVT